MECIAIEQAYSNLAEGIIVQAGKDYLKIKKNLETCKPGKKRDLFTRDLVQIEKFFKSRWYRDLTETDPDWLVAKLDEAFEHMKATGKLDIIDKL